MLLPLLKRATEDGVTYLLTPAGTPPLARETAHPAAQRIPLRVPGPGEQYRFHFDMGKCIGCKCCVVACNEQNGNPAAINWRRVGEIEGGWYPNARRAYLSMGCNHCVDPTCLSGCPVDAYTKSPATGVVLHSADACIGCQVLHVELLVRRAPVQPGARRRRQVRPVPQPPGNGPVARVRIGLPLGRHPGGDRLGGRLEGGDERDPALAWAALRRSEHLYDAADAAGRPAAERAAGRSRPPGAGRAALAAGGHDGAHAAGGGGARDDLAAAAARRVDTARHRGAHVGSRRRARARRRRRCTSAGRSTRTARSRCGGGRGSVARCCCSRCFQGSHASTPPCIGSKSAGALPSVRSRRWPVWVASRRAPTSTACRRGPPGTRRSRWWSSTLPRRRSGRSSPPRWASARRGGSRWRRPRLPASSSRCWR